MPFSRYGDMPKVAQLGYWRSRIQVQVSMDPKIFVFNHVMMCMLGVEKGLFISPKYFYFSNVLTTYFH